MTHLEFPWKKARKGLPSQASSTEPILLKDMKALGHQKLEAIERENPAYESVMSEVLKNALNSESSTRVGKGEVRDWLNSLREVKNLTILNVLLKSLLKPLGMILLSVLQKFWKI